MIRITQWLCSNRHCILACAYDEKDHTFEEMKVLVLAQATKLQINPWCGLCDSKKLFFEDAATPFKTMEEASGPLREAETANIHSRGIIQAIRGKGNPINN